MPVPQPQQTEGNDPPAPGVGVCLLDKPVGVSSFFMVQRVRRLLGIKKVGHAGTLDPFASGLLVVCAGRPATKQIERFMRGRKQYMATLQLGVKTETQDPEGQVTAIRPVPDLDPEILDRCLADFAGERMQVPPPYSAVKHKGRPLYYYARRGVSVVKKARPITIYSLSRMGYDVSRKQLRVMVACSPGTYIRVLAEEIGEALGCGAHLCALRRTASGGFDVNDALSGHLLEGAEGKTLLLRSMLPLDRALALCGT